MSAEELSRLMDTYRSLEGEQFQLAVREAAAYLRQKEQFEGDVVYSLWQQLQQHYGPIQVIAIVNDALGMIGTRIR